MLVMKLFNPIGCNLVKLCIGATDQLYCSLFLKKNSGDCKVSGDCKLAETEACPKCCLICLFAGSCSNINFSPSLFLFLVEQLHGVHGRIVLVV